MSNKSTQNPILVITVIFLFIISIVLFSLPSPYWLYGIPILFIVILILLLKVTWSIAGWGDKQYQRYFGDQNNVEFTYKIDPEDFDETKNQKQRKKNE